MLFSDFLLLDLSATFLLLSVLYHLWTYFSWRRNNIPFLFPLFSLPKYAKRENFGFKVKYVHDDIKSKGWKHGCVLLAQKPMYVPVDVEYIKKILTKDFDYFVERMVYHNGKYDPVSLNLFSLSGERWRILRTKLTPTFTSGKMRMMFETLLSCTHNLLERIDLLENEAIDIREVLGCYTTDVIGSCAFGLDCDSFKEENSLFRQYGKKFFLTSPWKMIQMSFAFGFPETARSLGIVYTPKDLAEFFTKNIEDTVKYRESHNYRRNDFMQLLIDLKNDENGVTMNEIVAQCFLFFTAGFEAASSMMTFAIFELSRHPDIQDRVREEISTVLGNHGGKITYDSLKEMKYLDQVASETLRLYPPVPLLTRTCVKDYDMPEEGVSIKKGTFVAVSVLGLHYDEAVYPEPERFDPDRFTEEGKSSRHGYTYLPFGQGPRNCIGARFGLMQTKAGLVVLLKNFKFRLNGRTKLPLETDFMALTVMVKGGIWVNVEKVAPTTDYGNL